MFFAKLFKTCFGSNILVSFTQFQSQSTDAFGFIQAQNFEGIFYINNVLILL